MLNAIAHLDSQNLGDLHKEVLIMEDDRVVDYYAKKNTFKELGRIDDSEEFGRCVFLTIRYLNDLHKNKKLFHGDIKPWNILFDPVNSSITTDFGSVVPLYEDENQRRPK